MAFYLPKIYGETTMKTNFCSYCRTKLEEGMKFCPKCGAKISAAQKQKPKLIKKEAKIKRDVNINKINHKIELKNNQKLIVKNSLIAAVFFALIAALTLLEQSPLAALWYLTLLSFFLTIISLIIAWMTHGRAKKLQTLISGENLLASWHLTPKQKKQYVNYLFEQKRGQNIAILLSISIITVIVFVTFILFIDEGKLAMLGVMFALILFLALFAFGMPFYYRYQNNKGDGQVLIGAKYTYINGYFHNWDYPLSGLSKIKIIKKPFYGIDLVYYYTDRTLQHQEEILIPANKEIDLHSLVNSMREANFKGHI